MGDFSDEAFNYLLSFEEILPNSTSERHVGNGRILSLNTEAGKKKKQKKRKVTDEVETKEEIKEGKGERTKNETEPPKKKKKNKKQKKVEITKEEKIDENEEKAESDGDDVTRTEEEEEASANEEEERAAVDLSAWSPFYLPEPILKSLSKMGFDTPTDIQREVLPHAVRDRQDILGAAETGSGKTIAYAIPVVCRLLEEERVGRGPRALIIAPTRELVVQLRKHVDALIRHTKLRVISIVGGLSQQKQERLLHRVPDIVVATPGRLWSIMENAADDSPISDLSSLRCFVVDETDRIFEKGHFKEMLSIVDKVRKASSSANTKVQTLVFSATLTFCHIPTIKEGSVKPKEKLDYLCETMGLRRERKVVDLSRDGGTTTHLIESRINCKDLIEKDSTVVYLLKRYHGRSMIFCNSVSASRRLYGVLTKLRFTPYLLHAKMQQKQRLKNLERFTANEESVLLSTDVAARGLDIQGIQHVIHYQVPRTTELYIHRSGRTARASHKGLSVLLVDPQDSVHYKRICTNLNKGSSVPVFPIDCEPLFDAVREQVIVAAKMDSLAHQVKKLSEREAWFAKTAKGADLDLNDRQREASAVSEQMVEMKRTEKALSRTLNALLAQKLPSFEALVAPKTRYVNAELVSKFDEKLEEGAMETVEKSIREGGEKKKRARTLLSTRHIRGYKKK